MTGRFRLFCTSAFRSLVLALGFTLIASMMSGDTMFAEYAVVALRCTPLWWIWVHEKAPKCGPTTHPPDVLRLNVAWKQGPSHSPQAAAIRSASLRNRSMPPPSTETLPLLRASTALRG